MPKMRQRAVSENVLQKTERLKQMESIELPVTEEKTFEEFIGTSESPIIIHDSQLEKRDRTARAQLRSVPFFSEFGLGPFLYDSLWELEFQLVAHEQLSPEEITPSTVAFPLVHLVTGKQLKARHEQERNQEGISQAKLTWDLLTTARERGPYIIVTDSDSLHIPSQTPVRGRPVSDHFDAIPFEYDELIHEFVDEFVDSKLPLYDTKNLYFHRVSECHAKHDAPASSLPGLFDYENAPAESPIWDPLYYFIEHELDDILDEYTAHVTSALRSWVERGDTEKIAKSMVSTLHRCDYDVEQLDSYRQERRQ